MYGWRRPGQGAWPILPVGWWILGCAGFWDKTFADVGVTTPRHKCTWVLTIEEVLVLGVLIRLVYGEIFSSVVFSIESAVDAARGIEVIRHLALNSLNNVM